ncbi:MAG: efflux RND transporter periplasmic adaptor subunit [Phycisphaerae bacterium]|nr:efflux RND transporter periplasmic adaptor subunit [Phycisphaerae bacterium]
MNALHALCLVSLFVVGASAPPESESTSSVAFPAVTRPRHDIEMAFAMAGRIKEVPVQLGDRVAIGELLVELEHGEIDAQIAMSELRASNTADIEAAADALASAQDTMERTKAALAEGGANAREVLDARTRESRARSDYADAKRKVEEAKLEAQQLRARLARTKLIAPFAGVIETLTVEESGAIDDTEPALRLVDTTNLKIDVSLPADRTLGLAVGSTLEVRYRGGMNAGLRRATITSLAEVADAASRTRSVRLEMPNDAGLPAGLPVEVLLPTRGGQSASAPTP